MPTQFDEMIPALSRAAVEFIIVGGVAARAHGSARLTDDLDISYRRNHENIGRVVDALAPYQPYLRVRHRDCRSHGTSKQSNGD